MASDHKITINVLLIEDDTGDAFLIEELLTEIQQFYNSRTSFQVKQVRSMAEGLKIINTGDFQVAVMDLSLPDSQDLDSLERLRSQAPDVPVVVLTSLDDEELDKYNRQKNLKTQLSLSSGIASFSPETTATLDQLLSKADSLMYLHKKEKRR